MAVPVIMPKMEMSQESATVIEWLKHEGDPVEKGQPLLTVETDKVTVEVESPGPGILMGMSDPHEPSSFNTNIDYAFLERVIDKAILRAPILEEAEILRGWGGLYAITPDNNPIIGALPEVEGLFCAIGFSGHGFQQSPTVGRILGELILDGKTDFDLSPFVHDRFGGVVGKGETRVV